MARRVEEDPPPVPAGLGLRLARAQFQEQRIGLVEVVGIEVEMALLRHVFAGPGGGLVAVDPLEADEESRPHR